ncbi:MAG: 30S ribosomal protein S9 [Proteobacteria bacterium]|nr:30S ribosomal protein S9 [Pseudomonadota bacterium]
MDIPALTHAVGKRKTSVARVWLKPGDGKITINQRPYDTYLERPTSQMIVKQPFVVGDLHNTFDVLVNVCGGGLSGQAEAIRHGISKAIAIALPEKRTPLKQAGLITRDARIKERKLPGQPGARKRFQFSKR